MIEKMKSKTFWNLNFGFVSDLGFSPPAWTSSMRSRAGISSFAIDALFPPTCGGCDEEGSWLCRRCSLVFQGITNQCFGCRRPSVGGRFCFACVSEWPLDGVTAAASYTHEAVRNTIRALKYDYVAILGGALSPYLVDAVRAHGAETSDPIIVPIPLAAPRLRWRGFNQSAVLARRVSVLTKIPYMSALLRIRHTLVQADLPHTERVANVSNAFRLRQDVSIVGRDIILIDDVATTGSTLRSAAATLKAAGAHKVFASVIAIG